MDRDDADVVQLKVRLRERLRAQVEASAARQGVSLSSEIVNRVEGSFRDEANALALIGREPLPAILRALQQIFGKLQRVALTKQKPIGSISFELATRHELRAAADVVLSAYLTTAAARPADPESRDEEQGEWGSGYFGRKAAYNWLEWEGDEYLDQAKGTAIRDNWTGDGSKIVADLVELNLLSHSEALQRRFPNGEPPTLDSIMDDRGDRATFGKTSADSAMVQPNRSSGRKRKL